MPPFKLFMRRRIIDDESDDGGEEGHSNNNGMVFDAVPVRNDTNHQKEQQQSHQRLQQRFESEAGVRPSQCWLDQCLTHLRGNNNNVHSTNATPVGRGEEKEIWYQVLHADLRDVVCEYDPPSSPNSTVDGMNNSNDVFGERTAAMQLRNAIHQSKKTKGTNDTAAKNGKYCGHEVTLPSDFRLLVQMEEVVDVSMSSEQQLAAMGGGVSTIASNPYSELQQHSTATTCNTKHRSLKIAFSDGYHPSGKTFQHENNNNGMNDNNDNFHEVLLAIETHPIIKLSVSSPPGLKLLLHGPVVVRVGLVQLNDANCVVIGGEIERWKELSMKTKERAQRERGLGVDPTIKALVWNPIMGDEEDLDEGEGESGDAAVPPPMAPPPMLLQHSRLPVVTQTPNQQMTSTRPNTTHHLSSQPQERHSSFLNVTNAAYISTRASAPPRALEASGGGVIAGNSRQRTLDMYPKLPRPETTRLMPSNNSNRPGAMAQQQLPIMPTAAQHKQKTNPYQRPNDSNISEAPDAQQGSRENRQHLLPVILIDDSPPPTVTYRKSEEPQLSNPYASLRPSPNTMQPSTSSTASSTFTSNPSFWELKSILALLRSDRAMYEQYYDKIITVPCKLENSANAVFNIIKSPKNKWKSKKEKEYEFYVVGKFYGPKQSDGAIACRVESSLIAPYFGVYTPAELRKLTREDKQRCQRIVNECMAQYVHDFSSLGQFQMKLTLTIDAFTSQMTALSLNDDWFADTTNPLLEVTKRL